MHSYLFYLATGACAGLASGLFGIGGGLILVPALLFVFTAHDIPESIAMHLAVGSSLASIVATSASSVSAHAFFGSVLWRVFKPIAIGLLIGALLGAQIAGLLSGLILKRIFAVFMLITAAQMAFARQPLASSRRLPGKYGLVGAGLIIGSVSSLVGIGGGSLMVPYLSWCGTQMRQAVGTSAAAGFPIAIAGTTGFILAGWSEPILPSATTGFVYWPAVGGIVVASILVAPIGARLAHLLPAKVLKRIFAVFLLVVSAQFFMETGY
ncbi:sulfite exporter TauE/SafE family protein [Nitrococcus mobilis]|uniref:Probable membrane transporter protein n=1 Tax=Nitrococcus mobilis Nb-231 TaxID=314278 RepID=A4BN56_9GAMM|nr:sulfite exporter TauE/SafE family protein [Nitrococcus mobilis]EAR22655.1 predicted Permease [Nitrococcus mobilis Nb-231]